MSRRQNLYVGRSGQRAVMAEFLWRGWNVAPPEVDVGEDLLVVEDQTGELWRVPAQFSISLAQLDTPRSPDLVYIFAVRSPRGWESFVVIERSALYREHDLYSVGSVSQDNLILRFHYEGARLRCSYRDFSPFRDDWSRWPVIAH